MARARAGTRWQLTALHGGPRPHPVVPLAPRFRLGWSLGRARSAPPRRPRDRPTRHGTHAETTRPARPHQEVEMDTTAQAGSLVVGVDAGARRPGHRQPRDDVRSGDRAGTGPAGGRLSGPGRGRSRTRGRGRRADGVDQPVRHPARDLSCGGGACRGGLARGARGGRRRRVARRRRRARAGIHPCRRPRTGADRAARLAAPDGRLPGPGVAAIGRARRTARRRHARPQRPSGRVDLEVPGRGRDSGCPRRTGGERPRRGVGPRHSGRRRDARPVRAGALLGSVGHAVLHGARCPVLVAR